MTRALSQARVKIRQCFVTSKFVTTGWFGLVCSFPFYHIGEVNPLRECQSRCDDREKYTLSDVAVHRRKQSSETSDAPSKASTPLHPTATPYIKASTFLNVVQLRGHMQTSTYSIHSLTWTLKASSSMAGDSRHSLHESCRLSQSSNSQ